MADAVRQPPHWGVPVSEVPATRVPYEDGCNKQQDWGNVEWAERRELQPGIVVRNTFIDVCPLEEESDGDEGSCASPHRRNLSAPPSPTRQRSNFPDTGQQFEDSDQEEEEDPGSIPNYQWAADGGLVSAEGSDGFALQADLGEKDGADNVWGTAPPNLPPWLRGPPGSPKKVPARPKKGRRGVVIPEGQQRPALGEFLKGESFSPGHSVATGASVDGWPSGLGPGVGGLGLGAGPGFDASGFGLGQVPGLDPRSYGGNYPGHHMLAPGGCGLGPGFGPSLSSSPSLSYGGGGGCNGLGSLSGLGGTHYDPRLGAPAHETASGRGYGGGLGNLPFGQDLWGLGQEPPVSRLANQVLSHEHLATVPPLAPQFPPGSDLRADQVAASMLPPDLSAGAAYISDNPPPHDPLGGHIPTEAPAYILGAASVTEESLSRPPPPQQPPPLAVTADASGRFPFGGQLQHPLWGTAPMGPPDTNGTGPSGSTFSTKPPGVFGAPAGDPYATAHSGVEGMPAFQIACGMTHGAGPAPGTFSDRYVDTIPPYGSRQMVPGSASANTAPVGSAVGAERGKGGYPNHMAGGGTRGRAPGNRGGNSQMGGALDSDTLSTLPLVSGGPGTPWISPHANINGPWVHPNAGKNLQGDGKKAEALVRGRSDAHDGMIEGQMKSLEAKGGRVPLSGGGPKRTDYIKKYGNTPDTEGIQTVPITTMMLKNIPCRKSQEEVMMHIDQKGFGNKYDFFYLPRDVKFRANLGYAFINFITPEDAAQFGAEMNGYRFNGSGSTKACAIVPAHVQGLMNNLAAFKRTEVMRSSRKPFFSGIVTP